MAEFMTISFLLFAYLMPTLIAHQRQHKNIGSISVLNLFLGWTFLGWVIALIWSFSDNVEKVEVNG